jgi:hypothetical protein
VPPLRLRPGLISSSPAELPGSVPVWLPWPWPPDWTPAGAALVGDDPACAVATAYGVTNPLGGLGEVVLVAEELGVGLGAALAAVPGSLDPETIDMAAITSGVPHARIIAGGRPTALWSVPADPDRAVYVGEAAGLLLWIIGFPEDVGYLVHDELQLADARSDGARWAPLADYADAVPSQRLHPQPT